MNKIYIIKVLTSRNNYIELKIPGGHIQDIFLTEINREWVMEQWVNRYLATNHSPEVVFQVQPNTARVKVRVKPEKFMFS